MATASRQSTDPEARHWWSVEPRPGDLAPISASRAYAEVLAVFGVFFAASVAAAGFSVAGSTLAGSVDGWKVAIPGSIDQVATTVLAVGVPVLLAQRRKVTRHHLGLDVQGHVGLRAGIRVAAWAVLALVAGSIVTSALATGHFPEGTFSYPSLTVNLFHSAQAGFLEEVVVLAFVVTTLEQARRPLPEIVVVALVLRASYHIYYGPGVVGIVVWSSVFLWLYLRFRTIVPLVVVHSLWDVLATLGHHWPAVGGLDVLLWLALFLTAPVLWLVERSEVRHPGPIQLPPPGWYPHPADYEHLAWWTGEQWWLPMTPGVDGAPGAELSTRSGGQGVAPS